MEDEYEALMNTLGVPVDHNSDTAPDESLLDVDDEEEVLVLDPPLVPTPAEASVADTSSPPTNNKVNEDEVMEVVLENSSEEDLSSQNTNSTIFTKYSKYGTRDGYDYSENEYDPESDRPPMNSLYHQCKSARAAALAYTCTNVEIGSDTGSDKTVTFNPIGSLNCVGDTEVLRTFRGSRLSSNKVDVNQNISLSFDPTTLVCVSCSTPHSILKTGEGGAPPIIILSDQNFLPTLSGGGSCVAIIRIEDSSLDEITDLALEILDRIHIPVGTIFLMGSASHLHNVGSSIYAADWCTAINKLSSSIRNVKILPLTPVIREDVPGSMAKQLIEISTWFKRVYDKNTLGLLPVWAKLTEILGKSEEDGLDLGFTDTYTVAFPHSLIPGSMLIPTKFFLRSSHTTLRGFDSVATNELLRALFDHLQCTFATVANSSDLLIGEPAIKVQGGKEFSKYIVAGGSNLKKIIPHLIRKGIEVIDLTKPGWTPTEPNIQAICDAIKQLPEKFDGLVVMDLLGNFAFRYTQMDGTLALPYKAAGKYHFAGKVQICSESVLLSAIHTLKPIFDSLDCAILFLSPNPRHLYNSCCDDSEHCPGVDTDPYVHSLLSSVVSLRQTCKKGILSFGKKDVWVPDVFGKMVPACNGIAEQSAGWKEIAAADGVHLVDSGYEKMAAVVETCAKTLLEKSAASAASLVSARSSSGQKSFY